MAMTKKEAEAHRKEVDALKLRVALCWTPEIKPDIPPPPGYDPTNRVSLTKGWLPCHDRVEPGCSSSCYHAMGKTTDTTTQGCRSLYSTRLLALRAVRHQMELRFAAELKRIDEWIELEIANPTPLPDK